MLFFFASTITFSNTWLYFCYFSEHSGTCGSSAGATAAAPQSGWKPLSGARRSVNSFFVSVWRRGDVRPRIRGPMWAELSHQIGAAEEEERAAAEGAFEWVWSCACAPWPRSDGMHGELHLLWRGLSANVPAWGRRNGESKADKGENETRAGVAPLEVCAFAVRACLFAPRCGSSTRGVCLCGEHGWRLDCLNFDSCNFNLSTFYCFETAGVWEGCSERPLSIFNGTQHPIQPHSFTLEIIWRFVCWKPVHLIIIGAFTLSNCLQSTCLPFSPACPCLSSQRWSFSLPLLPVASVLFALWNQTIVALLSILHPLSCILATVWSIVAEHCPQSVLLLLLLLLYMTELLGADEEIFPWWRGAVNISQPDFCLKGNWYFCDLCLWLYDCVAPQQLPVLSCVCDEVPGALSRRLKSHVFILAQTPEFPHTCIWLSTRYAGKKTETARAREWGPLWNESGKVRHACPPPQKDHYC